MLRDVAGAPKLPPARPAPQVASGDPTDEVLLDASDRKVGLPHNFRTSHGDDMSGSAQFSESQLAALKARLCWAHPHIMVVDCRREPHGQLNSGDAVTLWANLDSAHSGLPDNQVESDTQAWLNSLKGTNIDITKKENTPATIPMHVFGVRTERQAVEGMGMGYEFMPTPDDMRPNDAQVDRLIELGRTVPEGTWMHFHCHAGVGRTTLFMVMWSMLRSPDHPDLEDAMWKQMDLAKDDIESVRETEPKKTWDLQRNELLKRFEVYVDENRATNFATPWSVWAAARGWSYTPPGVYGQPGS